AHGHTVVGGECHQTWHSQSEKRWTYHFEHKKTNGPIVDRGKEYRKIGNLQGFHTVGAEQYQTTIAVVVCRPGIVQVGRSGQRGHGTDHNSICMNIRAVIVEDSRLARNELKELIKKHSEVQLVGEAENVDDGFELIQTEKPDLLFLDINMPEKDGFELLEMLDEVPITVFTTAFDEYAIKSFEY